MKIIRSKDAWNQSKASYDMQYYRTLLRKLIVVITFESAQANIFYIIFLYMILRYRLKSEEESTS